MSMKLKSLEISTSSLSLNKDKLIEVEFKNGNLVNIVDGNVFNDINRSVYIITMLNKLKYIVKNNKYFIGSILEYCESDDTIVSISITTVDNNSILYTYVCDISVLEENIISECYLINNNICCYLDTSEIIIGKGFDGSSKIEELLLDLYYDSKNYDLSNRKRVINESIILSIKNSDNNSINNFIKYFRDNFTILSKDDFDHKYIGNYLISTFSVEELKLTKELILNSGFGIYDITPDFNNVLFKIDDKTYELSCKNQGTGFLTLLRLLPEIFRSVINETTLIIGTSILESLHPTLMNFIFESIDNFIKEKKKDMSSIFYIRFY